MTGTTTIVSSSGSTTTGNDNSSSPVISDDGRFVAYESQATDLIPGFIGSLKSNVYLFDRTTGTNTLVSYDTVLVGQFGVVIGANASSTNPAISADGNYVAFVSQATDLVSGQSSTPFTNVFLYNRVAGTNTLVSSVNGSASQSATGYSDSPVINADGQFVAFRSEAPDILGAAQTGPHGSNIFVYDRQTGQVTLVSHAVGAATTTAAGNSTTPTIDGPGLIVSYLSTATNLVPGQTGGGVNNVFSWIRTQDTNFLASGVNGSITAASAAPAFLPINIGPAVLFSVAATLIAGTGGADTGYVRPLIDIAFTPTVLLDGSPAGTQAGTLFTTSDYGTGFGGGTTPPTFSVPPGIVPDNSHFTAGSTQSNNTAPLVTLSPVNAAAQSSFIIVVEATTVVGVVAHAITLTATLPSVQIDHFVTQVYLDVLQRPADADGEKFWDGAVAAGLPRRLMVLGVENTDEYRTLVVRNLYTKLLLRDADPMGLNFYVSLLRAGLRSEVVEESLLQSPEYFLKHGNSNDGFVRALYADESNLTPDDPTVAGFVSRLATGTLSRGTLASAFIYYVGEQKRVGEYYQTYLKRTADLPGLGFFTTYLQNGGTDDFAIAGLIGSPEFYNAL